jgi:hypothetical protein
MKGEQSIGAKAPDCAPFAAVFDCRGLPPQAGQWTIHTDRS